LSLGAVKLFWVWFPVGRFFLAFLLNYLWRFLDVLCLLFFHHKGATRKIRLGGWLGSFFYLSSWVIHMWFSWAVLLGLSFVYYTFIFTYPRRGLASNGGCCGYSPPLFFFFCLVFFSVVLVLGRQIFAFIVYYWVVLGGGQKRNNMDFSRNCAQGVKTKKKSTTNESKQATRKQRSDELKRDRKFIPTLDWCADKVTDGRFWPLRKGNWVNR
jgi:hypothetical protein